MARRIGDTRARLVTATNELFRRRGFHGTSVSDVTAAANAPTGSLYHFFPGGKDELTAAVLTESGEAYRELFELSADAAVDPATAVADFFEGAADVLEESDYIDPCPIGTVAREVASTHEGLRITAAAVFDRWIDTAAERFVGAGLDHDEAMELSLAVIAALEGGFVLARTRRDAETLRAVGRNARRMVADALGLLGRADPS